MTSNFSLDPFRRALLARGLLVVGCVLLGALVKFQSDPLDQPLDRVVNNPAMIAFAADLRSGGQPASLRVALGPAQDERVGRLTA